ncbi:hypothetical protein [Entomobacter blattae]|uniref:Uncharacterized protein n=1 Tax=Entomobacter blattae TaxID=2762277 RepID=A0A7H1NRN8_9PROT|nr:hypothetical protein [Entomobacter blattae]QNT78448.1 hypothetical protein JGUZn3_12220 [Entomobacter blattae]
MEQIFTDISKTGPKIQFNTGNIVNGSEEFNKVLPDVDGTLDTDWNLTMWGTPPSGIFDPAVPTINDIDYRSPMLGIPRYTWATNVYDQNNYPVTSRFSVYGQKGDYTYEISNTGGHLHDIQLQTFDASWKNKIYTFDKPIIFNVSERLTAKGTNFGISYQVSNSITANFNSPKSPYYNSQLPSFGIFIQIPLFDSRGEQSIYTTVYPNHNGGIYNPSSLSYRSIKGSSKLLQDSDISVPPLYLSEETEQLHNIQINFNAALWRAIQQIVRGIDTNTTQNYLNLKNWSLGMYYGEIEASTSGTANLSEDISHPTFYMTHLKTLIQRSLPQSKLLMMEIISTKIILIQ